MVTMILYKYTLAVIYNHDIVCIYISLKYISFKLVCISVYFDYR